MSQATEVKTLKNYVGGEWIDVKSDKTEPVAFFPFAGWILSSGLFMCFFFAL